MKLTALQAVAILAYAAVASPIAVPLSASMPVGAFTPEATLPTNSSKPEASTNATITTTGNHPSKPCLIPFRPFCTGAGKPPHLGEQPKSDCGDYATRWRRNSDGSWEASADADDTPDHRPCRGQEGRDFLIRDLNWIVDRKYAEPVEVVEMENERIQCSFGIPKWGAPKGFGVECREVPKPEHDEHKHNEPKHCETSHCEHKHGEHKHDAPKYDEHKHCESNQCQPKHQEAKHCEANHCKPKHDEHQHEERKHEQQKRKNLKMPPNLDKVMCIEPGCFRGNPLEPPFEDVKPKPLEPPGYAKPGEMVCMGDDCPRLPSSTTPL